MKHVEILHIKINNNQLGRLILNNKNNALFEYNKKWIESGFSISPFYLPLKYGVFEAKPEPFL